MLARNESACFYCPQAEDLVNHKETVKWEINYNFAGFSPVSGQSEPTDTWVSNTISRDWWEVLIQVNSDSMGDWSKSEGVGHTVCRWAHFRMTMVQMVVHYEVFDQSALILYSEKFC